ncbi:MAG: hypothetical protein U9Q69_01915 [Nanoarchaeota archaeon]|nr:hypothetical protein [Nanoarchaeota archaeon]
MVSISIPVEDSFKEGLDFFPWVNWSEVGREESRKKEIFDKYVKTGKVSDEDWKFCEKIDWHPVDELPLREEFIKELEEARKEKPIGKPMTLEELDKLLGLK